MVTTSGIDRSTVDHSLEEIVSDDMSRYVI